MPWVLTTNLKEIVEGIIPCLGEDFKITDSAAIHKSTIVENGVTTKRSFVAMKNCHIGANTYFREGVFLDKSVKVGSCSEIKVV